MREEIFVDKKIVFSFSLLIIDYSRKCFISAPFVGEWIQPGLVDLITINNTWCSFKGTCLSAVGQQTVKNKFIFYNEYVLSWLGLIWFIVCLIWNREVNEKGSCVDVKINTFFQTNLSKRAKMCVNRKKTIKIYIIYSFKIKIKGLKPYSKRQKWLWKPTD